MILTPTSCVFLVDDDEDDCFLVQHVFARYSPECQLTTLPDGQALLTALGQDSVLPSLVLLDINMPRMDGFEALIRIRQQVRLADLPVVMLTTSADAQDAERASQLGASGFITKPATIQAFNEAVLRLRQRWLLGQCVPLRSCA